MKRLPTPEVIRQITWSYSPVQFELNLGSRPSLWRRILRFLGCI